MRPPTLPIELKYDSECRSFSDFELTETAFIYLPLRSPPPPRSLDVLDFRKRFNSSDSKKD